MLGRLHSIASLNYRAACMFGANHLQPNFYNQKFLALPLQSSPLFPYNSYCFRVHEGLKDFLSSNRVNYLTTFLHREGSAPLKRVELNSTNVKRQFKKIALSGGQSVENKSKFGESEKHLENIAEQVKRVVSLETLDNMQHFNVAFDDNLTQQESFYYESEKAQQDAKGVLMISDLKQIHSLGTLCKLYLKQTTNSFGNKIDIGILRGLQQVEIDWNSENQSQLANQTTNPFLKLLFGIKQKEADRQQFENRSFFHFFAINSIVPDDLQEILTFIRAKPVHLDLTAKESPKSDEQVKSISDYKVQMKKVIKIYKQIQKCSSINTPDLIFAPFDPRTLDILCGYLCQTSYFNSVELQEMFEEKEVMKRVEKCLKLFEAYNNAIQKLCPSESPNSTKNSSNSSEHLEKILSYLEKTSPQSENSSSIGKKIEQDLEKKKDCIPVSLLNQCKEMAKRLGDLQSNDPEFSRSVQYLRYILSLPFGVMTEEQTEITKCQAVLDEDHYGLKQVKTLVVEFLAEWFLKKERNNTKAIAKSLLLVGPPGVGKSSIAQSVARSLGRKFVRLSVSGETDISAVTGHRRTYISSHAGKIVNALRMAGSMNPVILIDEIDKCNGGARDALSSIFGSDRATWKDNWIEHQIDLSQALIIGTANWGERIPPALKDRAEVIEMMGYTTEEKKSIGRDFLIPKIVNKMKIPQKICVTQHAITSLINDYSREPGVRNLERFLEKIMRKVCRKIATQQQDDAQIVVNQNQLQEYIGLPLFDKKLLYSPRPPAGISIALAYNQYGGSVMFIETLALKNQNPGKLKITGSLGKVMAESVSIAHTFAQKFLQEFNNNSFLQQNEVHIHFPEGASPKDGPSAGIAIATSLISLALDKPIQLQAGMTGELSLSGRVLQIGGIKEKLLAMRRENISNIILPLSNKQDVEILDDYLKQGITFMFVENYSEVFDKIF